MEELEARVVAEYVLKKEKASKNAISYKRLKTIMYELQKESVRRRDRLLYKSENMKEPRNLNELKLEDQEFIDKILEETKNKSDETLIRESKKRVNARREEGTELSKEELKKEVKQEC